MRRFAWYNLLLAALLLTSPLSAPRAQQTRQTTKQSATATAAANTRALAPAPTAAMAAARTAAERITAAQLKEWLYFVSSDEMAGRDTPSKGLDDTAKFIADKLAALKIKPAGDGGTYFQKIELISSKINAAQTSAQLDGRTFKYGEDFLAGTTSGSVSGELVYASHGYVIKSKNINAYNGLDVRNKIVIVAAGMMPQGVARGELKGKAGEGDWDDATSYARKNGAKGLIRLPRNFERTWRMGRFMADRDTYQVARFVSPESRDGGVPTILPSAAMIDALFAGERRSGADLLKAIIAGEAGESFSLNPNKKLSFNVNSANKTATTQNVIGILEGSDSKLKKEYVAIGAHYDHVGVGRPINGDSIYNGADDDGSGTVGTLAIAEAFARGARPKRSILFIWHCAEEKGLWGSEYFAEYPTVPLKQIVTQLNIDMIGRSKQPGDTKEANKFLTGANEIYVIGSKEMSTELGELSERINRSYLNLSFNYLYDDPKDTERFFYRSDHFNYAKKGIPIIFYFDGVHEDYHRPSDTPDKIDYQKMERVTRTVFMTASELANAPQRPTVDKPLTPERMNR
ncbi:MAG TPA: M28 family peptidase [Pyrinomonadaceae bacterium]|jgi:hypothetical protein